MSNSSNITAVSNNATGIIYTHNDCNHKNFDFSEILYTDIINWSIINLNKSCINKIYINTDNEAYLKLANNNVSVENVSFNSLNDSDVIFITFSNMPLISSEIINQAIDKFNKSVKDIIAITSLNQNTDSDIGYAYVIKASYLLDLIKKGITPPDFEYQIQNNNLDAEFYIVNKDLTAKIIDNRSYMKISDIARYEIMLSHIENGVKFPTFESIIISPDTIIGKDTVILPGSIIKSGSVIGSSCEIGPNSFIENTTIGDDTLVNCSFARDSKIGNNVKIGPFSNLRPNSVIDDYVKIGDFVEIKNSTIGKKTSVAHLTYVGDSDIGSNVNFGCGTVTVNYDGKNKFRSKVGDNVFIGCNTNLVSPINVGDDAYIAAGSTITDDIPSNALAIARSRQINKENWVNKRK